MASGTLWKIKALDTGSSEIEKSVITYLTGAGQTIRIPRVIWVLQGPGVIVVDSGVPREGNAAAFVGEHFEQTIEQEPLNALHNAEVDPRDVEVVIQTHLHWDHAGNVDLFPHARVLVQEQELRYALAPGKYFRKAFLSPLSGWQRPPVPCAEPGDDPRRTGDHARGVRASNTGPHSWAPVGASGNGKRQVCDCWGCRHVVRESRTGATTGVPDRRGRGDGLNDCSPGESGSHLTCA